MILTGQSFRPLGAPSALGRVEAAKEVITDALRFASFVNLI